jgi:ABC-2 type transport system permease protein
MSRIAPIIKREFTQMVMSRAFLIGTVLGPLLIVGVFGIQFLIIAKGGGGVQHIAIVDASGRGLADRIAQAAEERSKATPSFIAHATYRFDIGKADPAQYEALRARLSQRILADSLDGFMWIPTDAVDGKGVMYEGSNATRQNVMNELRGAAQRVIQSERLKNVGIDEARLGDALKPVEMSVAKTGQNGESSNADAVVLVGFAMAFAIYIVVLMYGQAISGSVQEEKRDRVVELIVSSVRARDLLVGKVLGIGAAGVVQMLCWVVAAAIVLTNGGQIAAMLGAGADTVAAISQQSTLPQIPLSTGVLFLLYFAGGFFLFATMFAVVGAIVTNQQEAQQFAFPVMIPFMIGFFIAMQAAQNPNGPVSIIGSLVPFTAPIVMPVRAGVAGANWPQIGISLFLLFGTATLFIWLASKIYRTAIFATGKKPSMSEVMRWMKEA